MSSLRSTATGGLALISAAQCYTSSCYVIGHHAPHKAREFSGDGSFCNVMFLALTENHFIVPASQALVSLIGIGDDLWSISILTGL